MAIYSLRLCILRHILMYTQVHREFCSDEDECSMAQAYRNTRLFRVTIILLLLKILSYNNQRPLLEPRSCDVLEKTAVNDSSSQACVWYYGIACMRQRLECYFHLVFGLFLLHVLMLWFIINAWFNFHSFIYRVFNFNY